METFYSLQGEGFHAGKPAFFIRIGGCDVGCSWCDTKESWNASLHQLVPVAGLLEQALALPCRTVVITGGEPLQYNLGPLCRIFREQLFTICLETSGSSPLTGSFDWICLSPKRNMPPMPQVFSMASELKVIIGEPDDLRWAEEAAAKVSSGCLLYLQPEWSRRETISPEIVRYILDRPQWRISVQSHKYLHIP